MRVKFLSKVWNAIKTIFKKHKINETVKYVTKFLCAVAITVFFSSCASNGGGCYDFGDNTKMKKDSILDNIEIVFLSKKENNMEEILTICGE
ncbi:MAG: hypothetical protein ACI86M_001323 [Saprospiraceae bacterium]|jgi:hypothetical protein